MSSTRSRPRTLARGAATGALAGLLGAGVMAAGEKLEQTVSHRPNSYAPGRTLMTMLGYRPGDRVQPASWNYAMHYGTGAVLGALRGLWAVTGVRGPRANVAHTAARLSTDQTLENATGVGAPPHTWPLREQLVDLGHKAVFSLVTGVIADRLFAPEP